jgi:hypothetical protein
MLEKHRREFPETYAAAKLLARNRLNDFKPPADESADYKELDFLEDSAGAMIRLVQSIAK